jgi:hypothetical protein
VVGHPEITRSSNLNFGAVVLEKRDFEQLQLGIHRRLAELLKMRLFRQFGLTFPDSRF